MKNPFPSIGRFFKRLGKGSLKVVKSDVAREIAAAAFTMGGLPRISNAIRIADAAIEGGESWPALRTQLIEKAIHEPEKAAILLALIQEMELKFRKPV